MKLRLICIALFLGASGPALAQQASGPKLDARQAEGQATFVKSCSICHLPPQFGAGTYGPGLNQTSLSGNESVMRQVISDGTPRMPAFKHMYQPAQIDAVVAYLKTVPAPPPAPPASQPR